MKHSIMDNKYNLTRQESLFLAKKKWDENIYCGMRMENRNITFPQTQTILNGINVGSVALSDIQAILNMRDAWKYLLDNIDKPMTITYLCKLNEYISRNESLDWGVLRKGAVGISGTDYTPPIPDEKEVSEELVNILATDNINTEKAIDLFLWGIRKQLFWDGNKRTSLMAANKLLTAGGNGILTIKDANMENFSTLLTQYYSTGKSRAIKEFLYNNAIDGIKF